jgi:cell division protein FtsW (lipid II flippase)
LRSLPYQGILITLSGLFLGLFSAALTFSPIIRFQTWEVNIRYGHWLIFAVWVAVFIAAHLQTRRYLPEADPFLLPIAALLSGWGLLTIWRLFPEPAFPQYFWNFGVRQTLWLMVAVTAFVAGLRLPSNLVFLRRYKYLWVTGGLSLTALTLLLGTNPTVEAGPRLWLGCCGVYFQPSEPLKLLLIVYLAAYLADRQPLSNSLLPLLAPTFIMTGLALLLLIAQRDLGTASIFVFLYMVVLYVATGKKRVIIASALILLLSAIVGYLLFDIVRLRVDAWINPWIDPSGRSYQIVQSLIAIANGGLLGRGPGLGSPAFVPIPHSDFIFAAIAEEMGFLGSIGLMILLALLVNRGLRIALRSADGFKRYLAAGLTAYLVAQSILIIGGNMRMLPLTGVPLPFVSYGGSSLLTTYLALLFLLHASQQAETRPALMPDWRRYLQLGALLLSGLTILALFAGWWGIVRAPELVARTDNMRRTINDLYVKRGSLLDRHDQPLVTSEGESGNYTRQTTLSSLGPILGYRHVVYGQAGSEASLISLLRGQEGLPAQTIWGNNLLCGRSPPGVDVHLSLDAGRQGTASRLLVDRTAAQMLMNADSGDILAMVSHPAFDPSQVDQ